METKKLTELIEIKKTTSAQLHNKRASNPYQKGTSDYFKYDLTLVHESTQQLSSALIEKANCLIKEYAEGDQINQNSFAENLKNMYKWIISDFIGENL